MNHRECPPRRAREVARRRSWPFRLATLVAVLSFGFMLWSAYQSSARVVLCPAFVAMALFQSWLVMRASPRARLARLEAIDAEADRWLAKH